MKNHELKKKTMTEFNNFLKKPMETHDLLYGVNYPIHKDTMESFIGCLKKYAPAMLPANNL